MAGCHCVAVEALCDLSLFALKGGLGGIGMGLGPGGQPISATQLSMGGGMGSAAPGGQCTFHS